jgi:hypothetical protein
MARVPEIYFDTNAFSDLYRHWAVSPENKLRKLIRAAARNNRIRLVTSVWTIEELGGLAERRWDVYHEVTRFVLASTYGLFEDTGTLLDRELQLGRALTPQERFIPGAAERALAHAVRRERSLVLDSYVEHRRRAENAMTKQTSDRVDALASVAVQEVIDGIQPGEGMEAWCRDLPRFIEEWTADLISAQLRRNRLEATLPHPLDSAPTALNFVAYSLARVCWYLRDGRRVERGDDADVHHYTCACYADEFVSGDERITKIVALIPQPRAKPIGMNEFAERFLSRPA